MVNLVFYCFAAPWSVLGLVPTYECQKSGGLSQLHAINISQLDVKPAKVLLD